MKCLGPMLTLICRALSHAAHANVTVCCYEYRQEFLRPAQSVTLTTLILFQRKLCV